MRCWRGTRLKRCWSGGKPNAHGRWPRETWYPIGLRTIAEIELAKNVLAVLSGSPQCFDARAGANSADAETSGGDSIETPKRVVRAPIAFPSGAPRATPVKPPALAVSCEMRVVRLCQE